MMSTIPYLHQPKTGTRNIPALHANLGKPIWDMVHGPPEWPFLLCGVYYGCSAGALDAESAKSKKKQKQLLVTTYVFFLQICAIFCMREAVAISYGSRKLSSPLGL